LGQFADELRPFLVESVDYDPAAVSKYLEKPGIAHALGSLADAVSSLSPFDEGAIEAIVRRTAESCGLKAPALIHATRVAVTGRAVSPGLFEVLAALGRERTTARLRVAQNLLPA
jgi:glutamyl/glutaminyl-tRNA synthetase